MRTEHGRRFWPGFLGSMYMYKGMYECGEPKCRVGRRCGRVVEEKRVTAITALILPSQFRTWVPSGSRTVRCLYTVLGLLFTFEFQFRDQPPRPEIPRVHPSQHMFGVGWSCHRPLYAVTTCLVFLSPCIHPLRPSTSTDKHCHL